MKLIDAIKFKGIPFWVQNCPRNSLPQFFVNMGYKIGAEIGVYRGEFTKELCKANLDVYAIDPWMGYSGNGRSEKVQDVQDLNFKDAKKNLSLFPKCKIIRKTSMDAVGNFGNESLDFVYIDGDHRFRFIAEDIFEWEKKVRKGGIVSGHDYFFTNPKSSNVIIHVGPVIDAFVKIKGIESFYIFGKSNPPQKDEDKSLSWLWIKK